MQKDRSSSMQQQAGEIQCLRESGVAFAESLRGLGERSGRNLTASLRRRLMVRRRRRETTMIVLNIFVWETARAEMDASGITQVALQGPRGRRSLMQMATACNSSSMEIAGAWRSDTHGTLPAGAWCKYLGRQKQG